MRTHAETHRKTLRFLEFMAVIAVIGFTAPVRAQNTECLLEVEDANGNVVPDNGTLCGEAANKKCSFSLKLCVNQSVSGCTPAALKKKIRAMGHCGPVGKLQVRPSGTSALCGSVATIQLKTKKNGTKEKTCNIKAVAKGKGIKDIDKFTLDCKPQPGDCPATTTTTTVVTGTTTTTTLPVVCTDLQACCAKTKLTFTNTVGGTGSCGTISPGGCASFNSGGNAGTACTSDGPCGAGTCIKDLTCGGLYFGGGNEGVPLPATPPDMGQNATKITNCSVATGDFSLTNLTLADTGSILNCTSGPGTDSGTCVSGNCTQGGAHGGHACTSDAQCGCLFGAPLPIPNLSPNGASTSTCVINSVKANAAGTGNCNGSLDGLSLPLNSEIYLVGDGLPKRCNAASGMDQGRACLNNTNCGTGACVTDAAIQPCPICNETTHLCNGGVDDGMPCTPGTSGSATLGPAFPTSHDCRPSPPSLGGLAIGFNLSTATQSKGAASGGSGGNQVFAGCGGCANSNSAFEGPPTHQCSTDADCTNATFPICRQRTNGAFSNAIATDITASGSPAGCLGDGAPHSGKLVSIFCTPHTGTILVDSSADLPGPGAVSLVGMSQAQ